MDTSQGQPVASGADPATGFDAQRTPHAAVKQEKQDIDEDYAALGSGLTDVSELKEAEEDPDKEKPLRRKRRVKGQKICGVCGDTAQSHNFGALTCETCKAFFRRNAFKQKELQTCVFNSSCTITKATRRFCAPCRLKKCYAIGMDPDLILDDEEKKVRQQHKRKREESRDSAHDTASSSDPHVTTSGTQPSPSSSSSTFLPSPGSSTDSGFDTSSASTSQFNYPHKGKWRRPRNAHGKRFNHVAREDLPWDMQLFWPLSVDERALLTKLTSAYQTITTYMSPEDKERLRQWDTLCMERVIFALEFHMRQFVEFARVIPEFKQLRQGDQIALLKASALQWYNIVLASQFIPERRSWVNVFGNMSEGELASFFGDMSGVKEYSEFCEGLKFVVKNDTTLYAVLNALVLFDSRDNKLENRAMVTGAKDKYLVLLKHYLESQFSYLHADRYLIEILQHIQDLREMGESSVVFYKHFSSQFRPLVAEVLSE